MPKAEPATHPRQSPGILGRMRDWRVEDEWVRPVGSGGQSGVVPDESRNARATRHRPGGSRTNRLPEGHQERQGVRSLEQDRDASHRAAPR